MKRVVVTGIGLVTPLGCGVDSNWRNLIKGVSGAKQISKFDVQNYNEECTRGYLLLLAEIFLPQPPPPKKYQNRVAPAAVFLKHF